MKLSILALIFSASSLCAEVSTSSYVTNQNGDGFTTPQTFNATVSGENIFMVLGCISVGGGTPITSAPTFNGDSLVLISSGTGGAQYWYTYGLVNPDAGTHQISVPWSDGEVEFACEAAVLSGVSQSSPYASVVFSSGAFTNGQTTTNIATTASGTAIFNITSIDDYITWGPSLRYSSSSQEISYASGGISSHLGMSLTQRTGATTSSVWTLTSSAAKNITHTTIVINPASSSPSTDPIPYPLCIPSKITVINIM